MLAQLAFRYGEHHLVIPWAYIAYVVTSFVLPWGIIKGGKVARSNWTAWRDKVRDRQQLEENLRQMSEQKQFEKATQAYRQELERSLPGIWLTIYDALANSGSGHLARHVIGGMICTDTSKKISVSDNPLTPEGARRILALADRPDDRDAIAAWIDDYVIEWIKRQQTGIQIDYAALRQYMNGDTGVEKLKRLCRENAQVASIFPNMNSGEFIKAKYSEPEFYYNSLGKIKQKS